MSKSQQTTRKKNKKVTIDASGRSLGRVASEAAVEIIGKKDPYYRPNIVMSIEVEITNASKITLGANKAEEKTYKSFSGYPGGLKEKSAQEIIEKKGYSELVRIAVSGMLPKNKLRGRRIKNLIVVD